MTGVRGFTGWVGTVLGTPDPVGLARFYAGLLGGEPKEHDETFVTLCPIDGTAYVRKSAKLSAWFMSQGNSWETTLR